MPFNPPGIIGGGSVISPAVQNDPFKGINDAITRARDRKLKDKALQLEAYQLWQKDEQEGRTTAKDFKTWYNEDYGAKDPNESQASIGGFFGMLGETAMSSLEGIGRMGKSLFEQGKRTGLEEVQANLPPDNDPNYDPGTPANDPTKVQRQVENENKGKFKKWLDNNLLNQKTNDNEFKQEEPLVYNPDYQEPEQWEGRPSPLLSPTERAGNWLKENVFTGKGFEGEGGGSGVKTGVQKVPESEYQKLLHGSSSTAQDPYGFGNKVSKATEVAKNIDMNDATTIKAFQKSVGLEPDGIFGPNTEKALRAIQSGENIEPSKIYNPKFSPSPQITGIVKAEGGSIPGNRTGDKNKAYLEDGEYVLNRNAVKGMGKGFLDWMNNEQYPRFKQRGGHVPGYQTGQYYSSPGYQNRREMEQQRINEEAMGDFRKRKDEYDTDINTYNIGIDKAYEDAGVSWYNPLNMIPGVWDKEQYAEEAIKHKADYSRDHLREAMEAPFGEGVRPTAAMLAEKQAYAGTPTASTATRLSNDALKKKERESSGNFNAAEFLQELYGDDWARTMATNPMSLGN